MPEDNKTSKQYSDLKEKESQTSYHQDASGIQFFNIHY